VCVCVRVWKDVERLPSNVAWGQLQRPITRLPVNVWHLDTGRHAI